MRLSRRAVCTEGRAAATAATAAAAGGGYTAATLVAGNPPASWRRARTSASPEVGIVHPRDCTGITGRYRRRVMLCYVTLRVRVRLG